MSTAKSVTPSATPVEGRIGKARKAKGESGPRGMKPNNKKIQKRIKRAIWRARRGRHAQRFARDWY